MVENSNRYIKLFLKLMHSTRENDYFNLEDTLQELVRGYNERHHSVTKFGPSSLYFKANKTIIDESFTILKLTTKMELKRTLKFFLLE